MDTARKMESLESLPKPTEAGKDRSARRCPTPPLRHHLKRYLNLKKGAPLTRHLPGWSQSHKKINLLPKTTCLINQKVPPSANPFNRPKSSEMTPIVLTISMKPMLWISLKYHKLASSGPHLLKTFGKKCAIMTMG